MKTFLTVLFACLFVFGTMTGMAGEKCAKTCCAMGAASATMASTGDKTPAADPHAGCPMKATEKAAAATSDKAEAATSDKAEAKAVDAAAPAAVPTDKAEVKAADAASPAAATTNKVSEGACPDVAGKTEMTTFHEIMHPMHMALEESDYAKIRTDMPKLYEASKGIANYKCPMSEKCSAECMAKFETKKTAFLKSVDALNVACQGKDDKKVDEAFGVMHEAYIQFAGMCNPPKADEAKAAETKATETK